MPAALLGEGCVNPRDRETDGAVEHVEHPHLVVRRRGVDRDCRSQPLHEGSLADAGNLGDRIGGLGGEEVRSDLRRGRAVQVRHPVVQAVVAVQAPHDGRRRDRVRGRTHRAQRGPEDRVAELGNHGGTGRRLHLGRGRWRCDRGDQHDDPSNAVAAAPSATRRTSTVVIVNALFHAPFGIPSNGRRGRRWRRRHLVAVVATTARSRAIQSRTTPPPYFLRAACFRDASRCVRVTSDGHRPRSRHEGSWL